MIVVADSSPLRYLILIEQIEILHALFGSIVIPSAVRSELTQSSTPGEVRSWIAGLPDWVSVRTPQMQLQGASLALGLGEKEAIALAEELHADALLADDEQARQESLRRRIPVQGTLGILNLAAEHGFLADLERSLSRLKATNFRASQKLFQYFLDLDANRKANQTPSNET